jgi:hypothetical protein
LAWRCGNFSLNSAAHNDWHSRSIQEDERHNAKTLAGQALT